MNQIEYKTLTRGTKPDMWHLT